MSVRTAPQRVWHSPRQMKLRVVGCKMHTCFASDATACKRSAAPSVARVQVSVRMNEHASFEMMKGGRRHVRDRQEKRREKYFTSDTGGRACGETTTRKEQEGCELGSSIFHSLLNSILDL